MKAVQVDGVLISAREGSRALFILEDLSEELPKVRENIQYLIEHMSGLKFEADPYINVNDVLPLLKDMRLRLTPRYKKEK